MNFNQVQVDAVDPNSGYGQQSPVVAEVVKIVKSAQGYTLVAVRDFAGVENVVLVNGRTRPNPGDVGKIAVFKVSGKTGNQGKVQYQGFYNPNDEIPAQYQGKRPPKQEGTQQKAGGKSSTGSNRAFALSYAKDLACAGVITMKQLKTTAIHFNEYMDTGRFPANQAPPTQAPVEQEIPEAPDYQQSVDDNTPPYVPETQNTEYAGAVEEDNPF